MSEKKENGEEKNDREEKTSLLDRVSGGFIRVCMKNKLLVILSMLGITAWGLMVIPFDWDVEGIPRDPVAVDAIPNIGENIQIVFTRWSGRSPRDIEDQVTYPLTTALLGIPRVKEIRSSSMFGMSFIYVVFEEDAEFYWSRTRILEKLNSLPSDTLPGGANPTLGPDATALGQIYWYTLEGRDRKGNATGDWSQQRLRSIQDWIVRYRLMSAEGVSEVASVGGFQKEYQVDVDPDAMRAHDVILPQVFQAVKQSNRDVGARTVEVNSVEYVIRGLGFLENVGDLRKTVVTSHDGVPVYLEDIATVTTGPALRRGAIDKAGSPAVGGVVVARYGENPMEVIENVKSRINQISDALPRKILISEGVSRKTVKDWASARGIEAYTDGDIDSQAFFRWKQENPERSYPDWVTVSQVEIVPFYDRSNLIQETLGTLERALTLEVVITIIVVLLMVLHIRSSLLISGMLPFSILLTFIAMKQFGVGANVVALAGIAIAIGTVVAMGIIICENILKKLDEAEPDRSSFSIIHEGASEVGGAALTAILTTIVSFLPVFYMVGPAGKLFVPLAYTKTFAMVAAALLALAFVPPMAHLLFTKVPTGKTARFVYGGGIAGAGAVAASSIGWTAAVAVGAIGVYTVVSSYLPEWFETWMQRATIALAVVGSCYLLTDVWMPLGLENGFWSNFAAVGLVVATVLVALFLVYRWYEYILRFCIRFRALFLLGIGALLVSSFFIWQSLGKEFRPDLEEGSFLYMPMASTHASIGEAMEGLQKQDRAISNIPEVKDVVGKIGRVESPLDPAPVAMAETIVTYKSEFKQDENGQILRYRYNAEEDKFVRDQEGNLIRDPDGRPFRQWRDEIQSTEDIWDQIVEVAQVPGWTRPPMLQPIETRLIMLQTGLKASMGIKVKGPDPETIEEVGVRLEELLKQAPAVNPNTVVADRIVGKPYFEIDIDRQAIARYGMSINRVQNVISVAVGGKPITRTVEGRERYGVRVRYKRELRGNPRDLKNILVPAPDGTQIPLKQLADIQYVKGPQMIKGENTNLVGYVSFENREGLSEVNAVEQVKQFLEEKKENQELMIPTGVSYEFAGSYQNQVRAQETLSIILPVALVIIFLILYFQFNSVSKTFIVFSGILVAWAGGFVLLWCYGQDWFLHVQLAGIDFRQLLNIHTVNLSIAVWVGFLALFGIATDHGVLIATNLDRSFHKDQPEDRESIVDTAVEASLQRIRPSLMMIGVTILALLPVMTSTGKGSNVMVPMAIPSFGGMVFGILTVLLVPVLYTVYEEFRQKSGWNRTTVEMVTVLTLFVFPVIYCFVKNMGAGMNFPGLFDSDS